MKKFILATYIIVGVVFLGAFVAKTFDIIPDASTFKAGEIGSGLVPKYNNVTTSNYTGSNISSVSAQLIAKNSTRTWIKCYNNGPTRVWLNKGATATKDQSPYPVAASGSFELFISQDPYLGPISAVLDNDIASTSTRFTCSEGNGVLTTY